MPTITRRAMPRAVERTPEQRREEAARIAERLYMPMTIGEGVLILQRLDEIIELLQRIVGRREGGR